MNNENLINHLIDSHEEIHDYIISQQYLSEVEDAYSITPAFLLNKSFEIITELLSDIGIVVHNATLYENFFDLERLSNFYLFIKHTNLIPLFNDNKSVVELVEGLINLKSSSLLLDIFDDLQVIFIEDPVYKDMYDLIFTNLSSKDKFTIYLNNILKISSFNESEIVDLDSVMFYIKVLDKVKNDMKQITTSLELKLPYQIELNISVWFNSLCNSQYNTIFGWYLKNKDDINNKELLTLDFEAKYDLFKKTTIGYHEYYLINDIPIDKDKEILIDVIRKLDPFIEK